MKVWLIGVMKNLIIPHQDQDPSLGSSHKKNVKLKTFRRLKNTPLCLSILLGSA